MSLIRDFIQNEDGFLGGLLGGVAKAVGGSLVSKVFGGKSSPSTNLVALRNQAEAAGFNPLTALQATGGGGFATSSGPKLASQEFLNDAISTTVDKFTGEENEEKVRQELENDLLRVQIDEIKRGAKSPFNQRHATAPNGTSSVHGGATPGQGGNPVDIVGNPFTPKLAFGGGTIHANEGTSDAEIWEQRYGDIVQNIAGVGTMIHDAWTTLDHNMKNPKGSSFGDRHQARIDREKEESLAAQRKAHGSTVTTATPADRWKMFHN